MRAFSGGIAPIIRNRSQICDRPCGRAVRQEVQTSGNPGIQPVRRDRGRADIIQAFGRGPTAPSEITGNAFRRPPAAHATRGSATNQSIIITMAKRCEICGKGPVVGRNISHAHNVTPAPVRAEPAARPGDGQRRHPAAARLHALPPLEQGHQGGLVRPPRRVLEPRRRPAAIGPYSQAIRAGSPCSSSQGRSRSIRRPARSSRATSPRRPTTSSRTSAPSSKPPAPRSTTSSAPPSTWRT